MKPKRPPVQPAQCATCPFRPGSKYADLAEGLAESSESNARICHSTGGNNAINRRTGKPPMICRGSRDLQLAKFFAIGFITAPTDETWDAKCREMGL